MPNPPRITFNLDQQVNRLLILARADDRVPAAERIRAGLQLWAQGEAFSRQVDALAAELRQARLASASVEGQSVKLTFSLEPALLRALNLARGQDGVPAVERIRAVIQLWHRDAVTAQRINALAADLRRDRMRSRIEPDPAQERSSAISAGGER